MKEIKDRLNHFSEYYNRNRAVGHTSAVIDAAKLNPNLIIIANGHVHENILTKILRDRGLLNKVVSCYDDNYRLLGIHNPIMFDNYTLDSMFREASNTITELENKVFKLQNKLHELKTVLGDE